MNEDRFWLGIWSLVAAVIVTLITAITLTMWSKRLHLNEMVKAGVDPIRAACALDMYDNPTQCVIHNVKFQPKE